MQKPKTTPARSLPQAGDSLHEQAMDLFFDRFFMWFTFAISLTMVGIVELIAHYVFHQTMMWTWLGIGLFCAALAYLRWREIGPKLKNIRIGRHGERDVARTLEQTRKLGYEVFHDIPCDGFNIDHALVGPGGVFAIETKTWTKPHPKATIQYDGERVLRDGQAPDRDPVAQAKAAADYLRKVLEQMTGRNIDTRPVILIPKWFIDGTSSGKRVWVMGPDTFLKWLEKEQRRLSPEDIALLANRLTMHVHDLIAKQTGA